MKSTDPLPVALPAMSEYMDLGPGVVHWKDYGGSGQTIVLVHGLGGSVANWDIVGPRMTSLGRVVALDLPGFGLSPPGPDWTLETHTGAIVSFIEHFGGPVALVGNSLGGLLSELVAASRPDLVESLVLIAPATPPTFPDPRLHWPMAGRLLVGSTPGVGPALNRYILSSLTPEQLIRDSLSRITHNPGRVPIEMVESFISLARTRSHYPWAADAVPKTGRSIRQMFMKRRRFIEMVREIKAPTLVVQGVDDPIVSPTAVEWLCALRADWQLVQMEDTGHTPQIDAPIRFLAAVTPWLEMTRAELATVE